MTNQKMPHGHDGVAIHPVQDYVVLYDQLEPPGKLSTRHIYEEVSLESAILRVKKMLGIWHAAKWKVAYDKNVGMYDAWKSFRRNGKQYLVHRRIGFRASTLMSDTAVPKW